MYRIWIIIGLSTYLQVAFSQSPHIHINQFGYYSEAPKVAVISDPITGFNSSESYDPSSTLEIRRVSDDEVIFTGDLTTWNDGNMDPLAGDRGWHLDFSDLSTPGNYYIVDPATDERSPNFEISENPYLGVLKAAFKMFYYNRSGMEKVEPYADARWTDSNNFLQDEQVRYIYDQENASLEKDMSGGWFDAGDYNKYVTFTYSVVHDLLTAYEANPMLFGDDWNIPESGNDLPDILDEIKWELDWMKRMYNTDGSVHIKMGSRNHSENTLSPPSLNTTTRYYGPTCTSASASFASNFAHAAIVYNKEYNYAPYAEELAGLAETAFNYVLPYLESNTLETECDDGSIVSGDADRSPEAQLENMVSAAIYLFEFTNNYEYGVFVAKYLNDLEPLQSGWWGPYKLQLQDALFRFSENLMADETLSAVIRNSATGSANNNDFMGMNDKTLYRDYIPDWAYHWGSSNSKAGFANLNLLMSKHNIGAVASQEEKAEELLHSFHGVNPLGIVYLSNMYDYGATRSCNEIYHTWFNDGTKYDNALTSEVGPPPGYVVGGPNKDFSVGSISPPSGQPPLKSYLDFNTGWPDNSWEISEPAIYYQAAYIRLLSHVIGKRGYTSVHTEESKIGTKGELVITPNPSKDIVSVDWPFEEGGKSLKLKVYDVTGRVVIEISSYASGSSFSVSELGSGHYLIELSGNGARALGKMVKI